MTPQITDAGTVILDLEVENNAPDFAEPSTASRRSTRSRPRRSVLVKDGQTAVVGGIYQSTETIDEDRTPFLGKIPILGYLFRSKADEQQNNELLLFITPRIVKS